ncbi:MAG: 3,4-dihydroxy-2-butanone-4-phosphate synthase [Xanthobacteraceae bacterium]
MRSAISALARGELVIVADDDDRESEGDLFVGNSQRSRSAAHRVRKSCWTGACAKSPKWPKAPSPPQVANAPAQFTTVRGWNAHDID